MYCLGGMLLMMGLSSGSLWAVFCLGSIHFSDSKQRASCKLYYSEMLLWCTIFGIEAAA